LTKFIDHLSPDILFENYNKNVNPIIEGVALSQKYDILIWIIEAGLMKGKSQNWIKMVDSNGSRNVFHLCSETNNG